VQYQWSRTGDPAIGPITDVLPYLRLKDEQAAIALEVQEHVMDGRGDDPYPWLGPYYDPIPWLEESRQEVVYLLNQGRRIDPREHQAGAVLDGRTWTEYPDA
jgi:hypothetical protein